MKYCRIAEPEKQETKFKLKKIEEAKKALFFLTSEINMELVDAQIKEMTRKELILKEEFVLKHHNNKISELVVIKNGKPKTVYQTRLGSKRPRCSTKEALIELLYDYYMEEEKKPKLTKYSFEEVFEAALQKKILEESPKEKTIRDYRATYKAFIDEDFASRDIRKITESDIKVFLQATVKKTTPTIKRFLKLKGLLNLVFSYALEVQIIANNPVPQNNNVYTKNCQVATRRPEEKAFQPEDLKRIQDYLWERVEKLTYDVNGYAILMASFTGMREAEIPALKWDDVKENYLHIHAQLNDEIRDGKKCYYYNPSTKNEKGISRDGRKFPITSEMRKILDALMDKQQRLGIDSEWVFAKKDGSWTTTVAYSASLYKVCKKLNLKLSNNHAFRMALNSYVFIPKGIEAPDRARLLGHSVETNLSHYTFARGDDYLDELCDILDGNVQKKEGVTQGHPKIIDFPTKEKTPEPAKFKGF